MSTCCRRPLEDELPELRYGTAAAQILGRMQDRKEVAVVKFAGGLPDNLPGADGLPFHGNDDDVPV